MPRYNKVTVLYHANCPDGFGSAYAFWKKFGDRATYIPVFHNQPPPEIDADHLYIADFSYDRETLLKLKDQVKKLVVIDHHITAQNELSDLDFCVFDMEHSGAVLSWKRMHKTEPPLILQYIEDRDLWNWRMPHAKEILSVIDSYPQAFMEWDELSGMLDIEEEFDKLRLSGEAILRHKRYMMNRVVQFKHTINIDGYNVPVVNTPFFQSEIGSLFAETDPFAAAYFFDGEKYVFSLRSSEGGIDVSEIAKRFGGGGHKSASGFSVKNLEDVRDSSKNE